MYNVIIIMSIGMICGFLLKNKRIIISIAEKVTNYAIYLLLFLLGITVGINDKVMNNLSTIGLTSLILSIGAVIGSVLVAYFIYKLFFRHYEG